MSAETTPAIDWDTYEPTAAVRKAAIVLFSADAVDATCFGWVPQAREALATALDVEEIARAIHADDQGPGVWDMEGEKFKDVYRENARAVRAALLGGAK